MSSNLAENNTVPVFVDAFRGSGTSMLLWHHLDEFWELLNEQADDSWYIYAVGELPPEETSSKEQLLTFIKERPAFIFVQNPSLIVAFFATN